jgi:tetratricopeptide (TPR) repeat protein
MNLKSGLIIVSIILGVSISEMGSARSESSKNLLDRGIVKSELGSEAEAIKLFDTALKQNQNLVQAYVRRGRSNRKLKQYQAALQDYNRALILNPRSISAYTGRGVTYELLKQNTLRDKDFDRALQIAPADSIEYTDLGFIYLDRKDYQKSIKSNTKAILLGRGSANERDLSNTRAYNNRAYAYRAIDKTELANADFNSLIKLQLKNLMASKDFVSKKEHSNYLLQISWSYYQVGKYDKAIKSNNQAIELDPKNSENYYWRGSSYQAQKKYELAINDYKKYLESYPQNGSTLESIARSYFGIDKYQEAILHASKAIEIDPKSVKGMVIRGRSFYLTGNYSAALADFNTMIKIDPKDAFAHQWRGYSNSYLNNYQQAILDYDRAIELDKKAGDSYLYSNRAFAKKQLGQKSAALSDYQQALTIAKIEGKVATIEAIQISIDDIQQEPQRIVMATLLTLLLTGAGYGGLIAIERRNEAKYLAQFQDL